MGSKGRGKKNSSSKSAPQPYRRSTIDFLNLVFGNSDESETYWNSTLKALLLKRFAGDYLPPSVGQFFKQFVTTVPSLPDAPVRCLRP